jgi:hypothetical protein
MTETARKERNRQRLSECFPAFARDVALVIKRLETQGFRPRIQDAHRSIEDQLKAFKNGFSKVRFGFHNITGDDGTPESLAVDLLDDNRPLNPSREYLIRLAAGASQSNLQTGAFFGLPKALRTGLQRAIDNLDFNPSVKIGFDPTHLEVTGITIDQAREGTRPQ